MGRRPADLGAIRAQPSNLENYLGKATAAPSVTPTVEVDLAGRRVLIVDDNATNRRVLKMTLRWQMTPVTADGGVEALERLERAWQQGEPFDIVLLDVNMPDMDGFTVAERIRPNPHLAGATILMLTSADRAQEQRRCHALGLSAYLIKPVTKRELRANMQRVLGRRQAHAVPSPDLAPLTAQSARPGRILLAEDNPVNVKLTVALLTKLGHVATVVGDGRAAVDAAQQDAFDLVLMDVQMPVMSGLDATRAIRAAEQTSGRRVPIIALTARAMKGDREDCLASGADDYLSKPVKLKELAAVIEKLLVATEEAQRGDAA